MRLISWQRLGIIASVIWVVVGPSYFHLNREDNDRRIAGDRYQLCIKQAWAKKGGVEGCNKELRQALAIAHWSQSGSAGIYPGRVGVGFGLGPAVPGEKSKEQATSRQRTLSAKS